MTDSSQIEMGATQGPLPDLNESQASCSGQIITSGNSQEGEENDKRVQVEDSARTSASKQNVGQWYQSTIMVSYGHETKVRSLSKLCENMKTFYNDIILCSYKPLHFRK